MDVREEEAHCREAFGYRGNTLGGDGRVDWIGGSSRLRTRREVAVKSRWTQISRERETEQGVDSAGSSRRRRDLEKVAGSVDASRRERREVRDVE